LEPISDSSDPSDPSIDPSQAEEGVSELKEIDDSPNWSIPGELEITPALKDAFKSLLAAKNVELEFRYGGWRGLSEEIRAKEEGYGLVISAETIYAEGSVGDLTSVLRAATENSISSVIETKENGRDNEEGLGMDGLSVVDPREDWGKTDLSKGESVVLIAAKVSFLSAFQLLPN
jgi:protein-histidine N-methyltransferase